MKKIMVMTFLAVMLAWAPQSLAEKPSCGKLKEIGSDIAYITRHLSNGGIDEIEEDSPEDRILRDLVDDLKMLSAVEDDPDLTASVKGLDRAWHDMDSDNFIRYLKKIKTSYDRLYQKDCL